MKKMTTEEFVNRANIIHDNFYDYSLVDYTGIYNFVKIICPVHGEFLQKPNEHINGKHGCKLCGCKRHQEKFKKKYGVNSAFALKSVTDKRKDTWLEKYGVDNPSKLEKSLSKRKDTWLEKYGVDNPSKCAEVQQKVRLTCKERYGVEYISQSSTVNEKAKNSANKRTKIFIFPSGNTYYVQGYEPQAINKLLSDGYTEQDLQLKERKSIKYFWSSIDGYGDDKWHVFHPDIIIPKENKIIEVKSPWTYDGWGKEPKRLSQNKAKEKAAREQGYQFSFMIIS